MEMTKSKKISLILLGSIVVIGAIVGTLFFIKNDRAEKRRIALIKETVCNEYDYYENGFSYCSCADKVLEAKEQIAKIRNNDLKNLKTEKYDCVQISMWNDDICTPQWFDSYFAQKLINTDGFVRSPLELRDYLQASMESENEVLRVFLCIDPYELEEQYYEDIYYDEKPASYEEYLTERVFPFMNAHGEVEFNIFLPCYSVSYLASFSKEELEDRMDSWYKFMIALHWCNNANVSYLGDKEWLVAKDSNYITNVNFKDELEKLIYLYEYAYVDYRVTGPEYLEKKDALLGYVNDYKEGKYDWSGIEDQKIVFMGDSVFAYSLIKDLQVPEFFADCTKADCYNLAKGGTLASNLGENSFCQVADIIARGEEPDAKLGLSEDYSRFFSECKEEDEVLFIINYGFNDYFCGVKISDEANLDDIETFQGALHKGINTLKISYPNSSFILLTPYLTDVGHYGKEIFTDYGGNLLDYVKAVENQAEIENVDLINMYEEFDITKDNMETRLADGVHPDYSENFNFAHIIYEKITK